MHSLLMFFVRYGKWMLFILYLAISGTLLIKGNPFQHYVFLTSAGTVSSTVYDGVNSITSYFNLRGINEDLLRRNSELELEILDMQNKLTRYEDIAYADSIANDSIYNRYEFHIAHVINNTTHKTNNYITIDKGRLDGITTQMGVVDQNGVVGAVDVVGDHASRVISLLNPAFSVSCKVKGTNYSGILGWDGKDYREAEISGLPNHAVYHAGDTIVTNGYSDFFPANVPVGTVIADVKGRDKDVTTLRVKLFTDFSALGSVRVIGDRLYEEIRTLDPEVQQVKQ